MTTRLKQAISLLLGAVIAIASQTAMADINYRYLDLPKQDLPAKGAKIDVIESPLSGAPQIRPDGSRLRIEVDDYRVLENPVQVWLVPSFGQARVRVDLDVLSIARHQPSRLWPDRTVHVVEVRLPALGGNVTEDLYDLHIKWSRYWGLKVIQDVQHRAVKIVDRIPATPKIATLADPQVGDPRALLEAIGESWEDGNLDPLSYTWSEVIGDMSPGDRWAAFQKTIEEINAQDPDFVLISGDLTFGASYEYEFEDAYRLLNQIQAPTYITPGNHDGYDNPLRADGLAKWKKFFGPLYYSVDIGSRIHVASINSYDWPAKHRLVTTWGGSVRDTQLNWLRDDLSQWRASHPDGLMITFAHHDPSWEQSPGLLDDILNPQDQQWSGANRLTLRKMLHDAGVDVHFAGHTHTNRVARFVDDGSTWGRVVETLGSRCFREAIAQPGTQNDLYDISRCSEASGTDQHAHKQTILDHRHGPLFVETTTISSDTSAYWGWRVFDLTRVPASGSERGGVSPAAMGYPMTDQALLDIADTQAIRGPVPYVNGDVVDVGYYSHPSYFIDVQLLRQEDTVSEYRVTNESLKAFSGAITQIVGDCGSVSVVGGQTDWVRTDTASGKRDVRTRFHVGAGDSVKVSVSSGSCSSGSWWSLW